MKKHDFWAGILFLGGMALPPLPLSGQEQTNYHPEIHGTIRAKYEYQPAISAGRFEVRNARFSLTGKVTPVVAYKAEIDLSDEGSIKMLDAYVRLMPGSRFRFTVGQMRVPFTIDAHRSPHQQYFANRSFIAKQVGNVRDVGATVACRFNESLPIQVEGGLFNGSGLTNQKDYWTRGLNYAVKAECFLPECFTLTLSMQKIKPEAVSVYLYDAGVAYHSREWHVEAEWLLKHYADGTFRNVKAFDSFLCYDLRWHSKWFSKISFLGRYDFMSDHSDGLFYSDDASGTRRLIVNDARRSRLTGGITLSLGKPFVADLRLNGEKYFYRSGAIIKPSERSKLVVEIMTRF